MSKFIKPVAGYAITTPYGAKGALWSSGYHTGVDFACPEGTTVVAVADGTVVSAGDAGAYGNRVCISHKPGFETWYCHLSKIEVQPGNVVLQGQTIALSGATGNVTGPHLHFEVRIDGQHVDPAPYLSGAKDPDVSSHVGNPGAVASAGQGDASSSTSNPLLVLALAGLFVFGGTALIALGTARATGLYKVL